MSFLWLSIVLACSLCLAEAASYDYKDVLYNALLFYQGQRSGKLTDMDPKMSWRKDSALDDKGDDGEDLTGGYYDAGDFVKFNFPMAFTATMLSWSVLSYEEGYTKADQLDEVHRAIRWATDYFLKCHVSTSKYYGQVGEGNDDHNSWGRPEDMTMARPAYYIDEKNPGSDLAGETAAALASASLVFKKSDPTYSATLLSHARDLYDLAVNHRETYSKSISDASSFYNSSGYGDELAWGAAWMHKATGEKDYLTQAEQLYNEYKLSVWGGLSWDDKKSGVDILLLEATNNLVYKQKIINYLNYELNTQNRTAKGLIFISQWGSLRMASDLSFILLQAADLGINADTYRAEAKKQIDYALGDTGRSYVVGYGVNPPTHYHHRAASCPPAPAVCDWDTYNGDQPNYNTLYGALVGGPGPDDDYTDLRSDYVHNEVACDYNVGFQGVVAGLIKLGY